MKALSALGPAKDFKRKEWDDLNIIYRNTIFQFISFMLIRFISVMLILIIAYIVLFKKRNTVQEKYCTNKFKRGFKIPQSNNYTHSLIIVMNCSVPVLHFEN